MAMQDDISLLLYGNQYLSLANKSKAIQCVLFHQVFESRRDQISDLMDGLNTLDILQLLRANNACLSLVFPLQYEVSISESDVLATLEYSQDQSDQEKEVALWFNQYVKYLGGAGDNADSPGFGNTNRRNFQLTVFLTSVFNNHESYLVHLMGR